MSVAEPMTLVTDYLLAAVTLAFAWRLRVAGRTNRQLSVRLWGAAFVASAAAALLGGTVHGFRPYLSPTAVTGFWKLTVWSVGTAGLLLLVAAARATLAGAVRRWLVAAALLKFLCYVVWMTIHDDFLYVILDYAPSLLAVLLLFTWSRLRRREPAASWVIAGILVSFVAAGIQAARLAPHALFNHNDLYHVVQAGAFWLLCRGGLLLRDR